MLVRLLGSNIKRRGLKTFQGPTLLRVIRACSTEKAGDTLRNLGSMAGPCCRVPWSQERN